MRSYAKYVGRIESLASNPGHSAVDFWNATRTALDGRRAAEIDIFPLRGRRVKV
jgi:hypothetical protein